MIEETFLRLEHSEGIVCEMASRILAAFISSGQLDSENENDLLERSVSLAVRLAEMTDRAVESDNERGESS